jgi:hypothetical protein
MFNCIVLSTLSMGDLVSFSFSCIDDNGLMESTHYWGPHSIAKKKFVATHCKQAPSRVDRMALFVQSVGGASKAGSFFNYHLMPRRCPAISWHVVNTPIEELDRAHLDSLQNTPIPLPRPTPPILAMMPRSPIRAPLTSCRSTLWEREQLLAALEPEGSSHLPQPPFWGCLRHRFRGRNQMVICS